MESENIHLELKQAINDLHLIVVNQQDDKDQVIQLIKHHIFELSKVLFKTSKLENYYWEFSSFSVYENNYTKRLDDYLKINDNEQVSEVDFINVELNNLNFYKSIWYLEFFENETLSQIQKSFQKTKLFLNSRLNNLESKDLDITDFVDLGKLSAKEKMVYLYKLGVIDFLLNHQPFTSTGNGLASVLSPILMEKQSTIQPIISAIVSKNLTNSNHPLYTESTEKRVNQQLINIGFDLK